MAKNPNKDNRKRVLAGELDVESLTLTYTDDEEGDLTYSIKNKLKDFDGKEVKITINLSEDEELEPDN